jgi:hypothetical protein
MSYGILIVGAIVMLGAGGTLLVTRARKQKEASLE